jgi:hypothetical protein
VKCCRPLALPQRCRFAPNAGPKSPPRWPEFISLGRLTAGRASLNFFDNSGTQVVGIRPRHRLPPRIESMPADSLIDKLLGIPRFNRTETCSNIKAWPGG